MELNKLYIGDSKEVLKTFPDKSVHCIVTSPPYYGLRQYLFEGAVKLRKDLSEQQRMEVINELEKIGVKPKL